MKNKTFVFTFFGLLVLSAFAYVMMDDNSETRKITDSIKEVGHDSVREVKSGMRKIQDETCELVDDSADCAVDKVKHDADDAAEDIEDHFDQRLYH